jgi:hypothetical protein
MAYSLFRVRRQRILIVSKIQHETRTTKAHNMSNIENITFGIEIETSIPSAVAQTRVSVGAYHNGNPVTVAPMFNGAAWKAERDCSIMSPAGYVPCEFVSPVLKGEAGVTHLIAFVEWLNAIGAKVNDSCGVHIHIGVSSFFSEPVDQARFVKILSRLASRNSVALYAQTGSIKRESGNFCHRASLADRKAITKACRAADLTRIDVGRYQLLNLTNLKNHKRTVEFRCFAGTTNIHKILAHLLSVLLLCKVAAARKSLTAWDPTEQLSGKVALENLLRVRPVFKIVDAAPFTQHAKAILAIAFEMAAKYDLAKAAQIPATLPAISPVTPDAIAAANAVLANPATTATQRQAIRAAFDAIRARRAARNTA